MRLENLFGVLLLRCFSRNHAVFQIYLACQYFKTNDKIKSQKWKSILFAIFWFTEKPMNNFSKTNYERHVSDCYDKSRESDFLGWAFINLFYTLKEANKHWFNKVMIFYYFAIFSLASLLSHINLVYQESSSLKTLALYSPIVFDVGITGHEINTLRATTLCFSFCWRDNNRFLVNTFCSWPNRQN